MKEIRTKIYRRIKKGDTHYPYLKARMEKERRMYSVSTMDLLGYELHDLNKKRERKENIDYSFRYVKKKYIGILSHIANNLKPMWSLCFYNGADNVIKVYSHSQDDYIKELTKIYYGIKRVLLKKGDIVIKNKEIIEVEK